MVDYCVVGYVIEEFGGDVGYVLVLVFVVFVIFGVGEVVDDGGGYYGF